MPEVKKATSQNIDIIQELAFSIWPAAYEKILSPEQLQYMLDLFYSKKALISQIEISHHHFILAYINNVAVGFASYSQKELANDAVYRLHKLYVSTNHQRKGIAKFLLNYIIDDIKKAGALVLELNVNRHNNAVEFYYATGFIIERSEDIDIGNGYFMNDYVMKLKLGSG